MLPRGVAFLLIALNLQAPLALVSLVSAQDGVDKLPVLNWPVPREWLNVQAGCGRATSTSSGTAAAAVGDGVADDTAAIQACFDQVSNETDKFSVYFPAGTYKVSSTLRLFRGISILIVGTGESSRIVWSGEAGGRIVVSDGLSRSRFVGLVFDGQDTAAVGFEHDSHSPGLFETRIRHQNNKFVNFLTAGIRIGHNRTDHKLETSEVLFENSVFANIGTQDSVVFNCTRGVLNCAGVAIENFNDYDNTFDGCHFFNNSWGIANGGMANVYVRNSRFDSNGRKFTHRVGPAVYVYEGGDIALAKSAGNSVRRCVSVNSTRFVASPGSETGSPTSIEGNVIDSWRGHAAISGDLRGPYLLMDNAFTNGTSAVAPHDPYCRPDQLDCGNPMSFQPWHMTTAWVLLAGNSINGEAADSADFLPCYDNQPKTRTKAPTCTEQANVFKRDLQAPPAPPSSLTHTTRFLKSSWPVPTSLVDARDHGCTGTEKDSTACVQATIDSAAAKGGGAAAYFAPRTYTISQPIHLKAGNYTMLGSGVKTQFAWHAAGSADPAVVVVHGSGGGKGLRLMHFSVMSGSKAMVFDTKILHDGSSAGGGSGGETQNNHVGSGGAGPSAATATIYDEIYTTVPGASAWNATGVAVRNLQQDETVHFVHLDGNLLVADSAKGTVFLNFMIQGSLNISGATQPEANRPFPSVAAATVVGLTDHDINVMDDQSVTITDYYSEQIKTGHLTIAGRGDPSRRPGRVTISAVKSDCYTSHEIMVDNYHGSLVYANSLFFEGPPVAITQTGSATVNITMLGNAFNGSTSSEALVWNLDAGGKGRNSAIGNVVPCMNCRPALPNLTYPEIEAATTAGGAATTNGTIAAAIGDWRRLGQLDLLLNHPTIGALEASSA